MTDDAPQLTNGDLARIFHEIGDMLELKGELVFKTVAYHRAADAIGRSPVDLVSAYRAGDPPAIPGVGKAISDKIREGFGRGSWVGFCVFLNFSALAPRPATWPCTTGSGPRCRPA